MTYADFETMKGDDPRFKALEKKEREALLNERYVRRWAVICAFDSPLLPY